MNRHLHIFLILFLCMAFRAGAQKIPEAHAVSVAKASQWQRESAEGFMENKGQLNDQDGRSNTAVRYLLNMPGLNVQLRSTGFSYDTWVTEEGQGSETAARRKFHRVDIELEGANPNAALVTARPQADVANVINEHGSFQGIRSYGTVIYRDIYPGIDLEFVAKKGTEKPVEYNFIVHPGADAALIKMKYNSGSDISLKNGMIEMNLAFGTLREKIPASYTQQDGQSLAVQYKPLDETKDLYAFNVPDYDRSKTLVIDPTPSLVWATYYGGSANEQLTGIDQDAAGNIYISGFTNSTNNIATAGVYQASSGGGYDMFLAKFTAAGVRLWGTYVGGANGEGGLQAPIKLAVGGSAVYLAGITTNSGLASPSGVHQSSVAGTSDMYLGKFNTADGTRAWATYYGGSGSSEVVRDISLDAAGNIYLSGYTNSTSGIASAGVLQPVYAGGAIDGWVAKFTPSGTLSWGTYLGGAGDETIYAVAVNAAGDVFVSGNTTTTTGMTTPGAFQTAFAGGSYDMFLASINSTGTTKQWYTYWGGDGSEVCTDLKIDPAGNLVAIGLTGSAPTGNSNAISNGLASPGALYTTQNGSFRKIVISKFTPSGSRLWSTYYGGTGADGSMSLDLDESGNILFAGGGVITSVATVNNISGTPSTDLSTNCTYQPAVAGFNEAYVTKLAADGSAVLWSTYLGGPDHDFAWAIKYLGGGNFVIGGTTRSLSGIATAGAHQVANIANIVGAPGTSGAGNTGFFARFTEGMAPSDVMVTTSTLNPVTQTACALGIPNTIVGNAISLYNPPGFTSPIFYQWQSASAATGPWTDMTGEIFKDLQPLASQTTKYYRRLVKVNNGYCDTKTVDSSAVASVLINSNTAPIADADGPQWYVCGAGSNTVTLNGGATGGSGVYSSYQWYEGSNLATPVATAATYVPTVTSTTTYTLKVTDNVGCIDVDQVTVVPAIANAGPDVSMCENSGGVQIGTPGTPGGSVSYSWTPATGLNCTNCAQPIASPAATTAYQLTTTVTRKDGTTCSTTDNVTVTFVTAPTGGAGFGGTDKTICKNSTVVLGGANDAAATYNWSPTSYLSASNIYNPTFDAGTNNVSCPMVYTVTAAKSGCTFTDQVSVNVIDASTSMDGQTATCQGWSYGSSNNCSGATYSWQLVSGPGVVPAGSSLSGGGANAYLVNNGTSNAVYRRVTTLNGVSCTSGDMTVAPCSGSAPGCPIATIQVLGPQGCPKVFGQQELQLYVSGVNVMDYSFSWTPANIMDNPTAATVNITSTSPVTVNVTLTNIHTGMVCTVPGLPINNPAWSLPVLTVSDKNTCPSTPVAIGEPSASGFSYNWSPATGLNLANISNPVASLSTSAAYTVTKTDNSNGCKTTGNVLVNVSEINFDAGPSHAVCNGATVTLGTVPGGSYTYSWTPVGAAWTNGTGPTNANPQVLFAGSSQTFNVTVTDPASGCQKTDAVILSGTITPGEYAGPAIGPLCPGETAQLGITAVPNASYSWSPATGLSCTTCANPTVTAGAASQTYSVTVSYPGCSTPVTDNVTVSVNTLPAVTLTDKNVCPTTPTNIGIGGTGNTATLAGVASYLWSPASGLSCTNCASPDANPQATTTYNVVITLTNGCVINEDVVVTPSVIATAKPDATICPGSSVVLGSPAVPNVTYSWAVLSGTPGSITPTNIAQPTANPTATSIYRLTATGTGPNAGCTITDDATVTVKTLPAITVTGNTAVCQNGATTLSVNPVTPNIIYQWSPLSGVVSPNSPTTIVMPSATTLYRVTQTDLNSGCSDYKEVNVTVWPNNVTATGGAITVCPSSQDTLPLTVSPASGNTISWSPATYLSNPYVQNPVIYPQGSGNYIATVTNTTSNCSDTALVTVTVPATCTGSDYGDVPYGYENGNPASHGISPLIKIGTATDAEGGPVSALVNAPAIGDDGNNQINDEEGISFLPVPNTGSQSLNLVVYDVLNKTGNPAYLVSWIDFNRDGDFNDAGERSQIVQLSVNDTLTNPVMQFNGFNTGCAVQAGLSYLRVRLTSDTTGGWNNAPSANGSRTNGEVEDYAITLMGADFGDAPAAYPVVKAIVNPDLNNDGSPDATGSVWLGNTVDYNYSCNYLSSSTADADDNDFTSDDEDGLQMSSQIPIGTPVPWTITVNSQGPVTGALWGMWIDWNADGTFDNFYTNSVNTTSAPTAVTVNVTAPANAIQGFIVRVAAKAPGTAFTLNDYNSTITNGEWEDYIRATPLPVHLQYFNATAKSCTGEVSWATANERNSNYFEVEQSTDGTNWKVAEHIKAAHNASMEQTYSTTVPLTSGINNYLRLKMVDEDGNKEYSMVRVLRCDNRMPILIWPNPTTMNVQISGLPEGGTIQILEVSGKEVIHVNNVSPTETIGIENLPSAIYQVIIFNKQGEKIEVQQLVKKN